MIIEISKSNLNEYTDNNFFKEKDILAEIKSNPFANYIIFFDKIVKGYLYYSKIYDRLEINQIEVLKNYRNQKIASTLLDYLINKEKLNISLEVRSNNDPAINLYKKYNFKQTAIRKNYYNTIDGLLMERIYEK